MTTKARISKAETVSAEMGDDGQIYTNKRGINLDDVCRALGASVATGSGKDYDSVRYLFPDGSAIVSAHGHAGWDIEGSEPWSWEGAE